MVTASPKREWLSVVEAAALAGCTDGWLRLLLGQHHEEWEKKGLCWKVGQRAWGVHRSLAVEIGKGLSTRALGKREPKPAKKPRKKAS